MEALVEGLRTDATSRRGALTGIFGSNAGLCGEYTTLGVRGIAPASQQKRTATCGGTYYRVYRRQCERTTRGVGGGSRWLSRVLVWNQTCPNAVYTDAFALGLVQFRFRPYARAPLSPLP